MTQEQKAFIERVGALAAADMQKSGVLASLTIAQAILESGWGKSGLTVKANALFGIKAGTSWKGRVYSTKTQECYDGVNFTTVTALFRAYDSWEESVADHSALHRNANRGKPAGRWRGDSGSQSRRQRELNRPIRTETKPAGGYSPAGFFSLQLFEIDFIPTAIYFAGRFIIDKFRFSGNRVFLDGDLMVIKMIFPMPAFSAYIVPAFFLLPNHVKSGEGCAFDHVAVVVALDIRGKREIRIDGHILFDKAIPHRKVGAILPEEI